MLAEALVGLLRRMVQPALDRSALYGAVVVEHRGDRVACRPFDPRLPETVEVPIRTGIPASFTGTAGSRCLLGFDAEGGLFVLAWDEGDGIVTLGTSSAGTPIARVGDVVEVARPLAPLAISGAVTGAAVVPPGPKLVGTILLGTDKVLAP